MKPPPPPIPRRKKPPAIPDKNNPGCTQAVRRNFSQQSIDDKNTNSNFSQPKPPQIPNKFNTQRSSVCPPPPPKPPKKNEYLTLNKINQDTKNHESAPISKPPLLPPKPPNKLGGSEESSIQNKSVLMHKPTPPSFKTSNQEVSTEESKLKIPPRPLIKINKESLAHPPPLPTRSPNRHRGVNRISTVQKPTMSLLSDKQSTKSNDSVSRSIFESRFTFVQDYPLPEKYENKLKLYPSFRNTNNKTNKPTSIINKDSHISGGLKQSSSSVPPPPPPPPPPPIPPHFESKR